LAGFSSEENGNQFEPSEENGNQFEPSEGTGNQFEHRSSRVANRLQRAARPAITSTGRRRHSCSSLGPGSISAPALP
jgi:hypothetical protein